MKIKFSPFYCFVLLCTFNLSAQNLTIDLNEEYQTIRGFGGMVHNIWQGGGALSEADGKIAFGSGEGELGLTVLRIPVNENKNDWDKDLNAAKIAQSHGAIVYASPWNPPSGMRGSDRKIAEKDWQAYVDHLNDFAAHMINKGVPLYAISIQNEPDWCNEWTCWSADELYKFTKNYADKLRKNNTKVISAESFAYVKTLYDKILNDANALKNLDIVGVHFYGSNANTNDQYFQYPLANQKLKEQELWMTEHYTESQGSANMWRGVIQTGDQDQQAKLDTVRALDVGYDIHRALAVGNFNQYTWWYIRRHYGLIMEKDFSNKLSIPSNEIGKPSKRGYVFSQYARFVRPGSIRVGATAKPMNQVFASAYKKADSVVIVIINRDAAATKTLDISVQGAPAIKSWTKYVTSESKNVKNEGEIASENGRFSISLDKESIVTLVGLGPQIVIPQTPYLGVASKIPGKIEAENYDIGGQNKSYYDVDSENKGDALFRIDEGVDIVAIDDGLAVGYTMEGEWLEYTVDVEKSGKQNFIARVSSGVENASFQLFMDDQAITDTIFVPKGEDWDTYTLLEGVTQDLSAGEHIFKILITGSFVNIDWIEFGDPSISGVSLPQNFSKSKVKDFEVYDLHGKHVGSFSIESNAELKQKMELSVQESGVYFIKSQKGNLIKRISIIK